MIFQGMTAKISRENDGNIRTLALAFIREKIHGREPF
jgi:hypothetical protein